MTRARETSENARQAKAWVNFNSIGTVSIRESFNVASITDHGVGDFSINFINAMTSANYCILGFGNGPVNTHHCHAWANYGRVSNSSSAAIQWFRDENSFNRADPGFGYVLIYQ